MYCIDLVNYVFIMVIVDVIGISLFIDCGCYIEVICCGEGVLLYIGCIYMNGFIEDERFVVGFVFLWL